MSLRYTGEATMDEPALRDVERWKDKIEVRLDNRQVFFLFFGSAMVACMLFVLGVIVGKRLESRGRAVAPVVEDPLAALDRFGDRADTSSVGPKAPSDALTFPRALLGSSTLAKTERSERAAARTTLTTAVPGAPALVNPTGLSPTARKVAAVPRPIAAATPAPTTAPAPVSESAPKIAAASAAKPVAVAAVGKPVASVGKPAVSAVSISKPVVVASATKPVSSAAAVTKPIALAASPAKPVAARSGAAKVPVALAATPPATASASHTEKAKGGFALQLSSFQDRAEADAFARRFAAQNAHIVVSEIPGKGTWYRVRVGSYGNMKDAASAKANFEHDHGVIAYVAGSGPAQ